MNKFLTPLFAVLLVLLLASLGFGQGATRDFTYYDDGEGAAEPPLGNACPIGTGTPLPDNSAQVCIYWDNNGNGPDAADVQPPQSDSICYGCFNYVCLPMNGTALGVGAGYWSTYPTGYALAVSQLPEAPDLARYYWRINAALNGDTVCWTSAVYTLTSGYEEIFIPASDWTCTAGPCPTTGTPPAAPTNVVATDDQYCLASMVTWQHDGANVTGFSVYDQTGFLGSVNASARAFSATLNDALTHSFYVKATNSIGASEESNHDNGSGYLLRFAAGAPGNLYGDFGCGAPFTIHFSRPDNQCGSLDSLFVLGPNGQIFYYLCVDSLVDVMHCTLPDPGVEMMDLRLMVRAYYLARQVMQADTTDSTFNLCTVSADDRPLAVPDYFSLEQNYPNPFNATTMIDFVVPFESDVTIQVYNISGQLVKTLVSGSVSAGVHHVTWNGISDGGFSVSSGLYFYRMSGPGFVQTKKLLLMK